MDNLRKNAIVLFFLSLFCDKISAKFKCGCGIADITGPIAEINMMGYAKFGQDTAGIHFRLYSRSFVVEDDKRNIIAYSTLDLGMISNEFRNKVIKTLNAKFGNRFSVSNVMFSTTHTHSGPGGYMPYLLYIINALGFDKQNFAAIVKGTTLSIIRAIKSKETCKLFYNEGSLLGASINRSPTSYLKNPERERNKYRHNVDPTMSSLKLVSMKGKVKGIFNWFAVHSTSMNNSNLLVSGDNKGYASMRMERELNPHHLPGKGPIVAAFPTGNEGDLSPNTKGPKCSDTRAACDLQRNPCKKVAAHSPTGINNLIPRVNADSQCIASGPGNNMFESTEMIGEMQYRKAKELMSKAREKVHGEVSHIHQFVDMSNVILTYNGKPAHTCKSSLGVPFAAGTTDGAGLDLFPHGSKVVWDIVQGFRRSPTQEMRVCHDPKLILLPTGIMKLPYDWQPQIVPTQILQIGNIVIVGLPGEFTTMSGRRMRETVQDEVAKFNPKGKVHVVIVGLANEYASYVTTFEEYQERRYEGASTIYGPHTLEAYRLQYKKLAHNLVRKSKLPPGPNPPNNLQKQITIKPGVIYDTTPLGKKFGDVLVDAKQSYNRGQTASATFVSANPRNDLFTEKTFLNVEYLDRSSQKWIVVATDANWETKYHWKRTSLVAGTSTSKVEWSIPLRTPPGNYKLRVFGVSKQLLTHKKWFTGASRVFNVH